MCLYLHRYLTIISRSSGSSNYVIIRPHQNLHYLSSKSKLFSILQQLVPLKHLIQLHMFQSFQIFYFSVKDIPLYWESLEETLRIKQDIYPTNRQIYDYYQDTFKAKTSSFGRSKWHRMDKLLCVWMISQYSQLLNRNILELEKEDFKVFSVLLGVESELLEFKWLKLIKPYLKNKPWSQEEDEIINQLMKSKIAKRWTEIALRISEASGSSGLRTAKQVRQRWINYLDPTIKRNDWTKEEDEELFRIAQHHGRKWSVLGKLLKRTENSIKNRYHSMLAKLKEQEKNTPALEFKQPVQPKPSLSLDNELMGLEFQTLVTRIETKVATYKLLEQKVCRYRTLSCNSLTE